MNAAPFRALVIGADGLIGRALCLSLRAGGHQAVETTRRERQNAPHRLFLDLAQPLAGWRPPPDMDCAYICAAATDIGRCRDKPAETALVNVSATVELAEKLVAENIFTVFLSTSRVFGAGGEPGRAEDNPAPVDQYARQKAAAEKALLGLGDGVAVVRLTKVLDPALPLVRGWMDRLAAGEAIHPFSDMTLAPLGPPFVALALERIGRGKMAGIFHLSGARAISYADMAGHIARRMGAPEGLVRPVPAAGEWLPAAAHLDCARMETELATAGPDPFAVIDEVFGLKQAAPT